jgi:hypothetical protein
MMQEDRDKYDASAFEQYRQVYTPEAEARMNRNRGYLVYGALGAAYLTLVCSLTGGVFSSPSSEAQQSAAQIAPAVPGVQKKPIEPGSKQDMKPQGSRIAAKLSGSIGDRVRE